MLHFSLVSRQFTWLLRFSPISRQITWLLHDQQGAGMYTGIALPLSPTVKLYTADRYYVLV